MGYNTFENILYIGNKRTFENGLEDPFVASYEDNDLSKMKPISQFIGRAKHFDELIPSDDAPDVSEMSTLKKFYDKDQKDADNVFTSFSSSPISPSSRTTRKPFLNGSPMTQHSIFSEAGISNDGKGKLLGVRLF